MKRATLNLFALAATALGGCSMCQSPYDYQGPVTNSPAGYGQRQGSIAGGGTTVPAMEMSAAPHEAAAIANGGNNMAPIPAGQAGATQRY